VNEHVWQAILDREKNGATQDMDRGEVELTMMDDETEDELEEEWDDREFVSDVSGDEDGDGLSDLEGISVSLDAIRSSPSITGAFNVGWEFNRRNDR